MTLIPKLGSPTWGDIIAIVAWITLGIYTFAFQRADVMALRLSKDDHEVRIRVFEQNGSAGLSKHVAVDDQRQASTDAEVMRLRKEVAEMQVTLVRIDTTSQMTQSNVVLLLSAARQGGAKE
jgi:hypothetical protein